VANTLAVSQVHQEERARKEDNGYERGEKQESRMHSQIWSGVSDGVIVMAPSRGVSSSLVMQGLHPA
jgi:hypothetical protein